MGSIDSMKYFALEFLECFFDFHAAISDLFFQLII